MRKYVCVFVRIDIPLVDQIVQVAHSCLLAGEAFGTNKEHLRLYQIDNEDELVALMESLDSKCIMYKAFYEPRNAAGERLGYTALTTEAMDPLEGCSTKLYKFTSFGPLISENTVV